jgi:DNA-binding transcriptional LysR family regulator
LHITLRQLQIFVAIAEMGSTASAAREIALTQSAASASLNELEDLLGARLFDRTGRRLLINGNGRALLPKALWLLEGASEVERQFSAARTPGAGPLRIGASTTIGNYLMPRMLTKYQKLGDISEVNVRIANTKEIVSEVGSFKLDIGFIEGPSHEAKLIVRPWLKDDLVVIAAPKHSLALHSRDEKLSLVQLREARWLLRELGSGTREAVENALLPKLHSIRSDIAFGDSEAIKHAVAEGLGVSCLSRLVVGDMLRQKSLVELRTSLQPLSRNFYIVFHPDKYMSDGLKNFLAFSEQMCAQK